MPIVRFVNLSTVFHVSQKQYCRTGCNGPNEYYITALMVAAVRCVQLAMLLTATLQSDIREAGKLILCRGFQLLQKSATHGRTVEHSTTASPP